MTYSDRGHSPSDPGDERRIRVLRVIARMNLGGPAHHVSLLGGGLDDRYETLLVAGRVPPNEASAEHLVELRGVRRVSLSTLRPELHPGADLRALLQLASIIRRFRPDIVHTHTAKAGFVGRLAARLAGTRRPLIVHTYHGHVLEGYFGRREARVYRQLEQLAGRLSDVLIGVSQATVDDLVRLRVAPRSKFRVIPIGLDLSPFRSVSREASTAIRAEVGVRPHEVLVTFVGRLASIKRPDVAVRSLALARGKGAPARLAVVGHGDLQAQVEQVAADLRIAEYVHFLGWRPETAPIAAATDIALLTSANEGTPVWLIEAAAAGAPAVTTLVGGVGEVVTEETGVLAGSGDENALAEGIRRLALDGDLRLRMGERAQAHVQQAFSIERLLSDIDALYQEMLLQRTGSTERRCVESVVS
jgi:glycosyltransferase involved in cell wall biosynthesis